MKKPKEVKWILVHKDGKHLVPKNNTHFLDCNLTPRELTMSCDGGMVLVEMEDYEVNFLDEN